MSDNVNVMKRTFNGLQLRQLATAPEGSRLEGQNSRQGTSRASSRFDYQEKGNMAMESEGSVFFGQEAATKKNSGGTNRTSQIKFGNTNENLGPNVSAQSSIVGG